MKQVKRKTYTAPTLKRYGAMQEITQAIIYPGSGDILSQIVEDTLGVDVNDGCSDSGWSSYFCPS